MKKINNIVGALKYLLIFWITPIVCALLVSLIYILLNSLSISLPKISAYFIEIIACAVILAVFYFILKEKKYKFENYVKLKRIRLSSAISFVCLGLSAFFVLIILLNCFPILQGSGNTAASNDLSKSVKGLDILFLFAAKGIAAPIVEEVTFRGLIYSKLKEAFPTWFSSLLVSLIFGVLHFSSSIFTVLTAILISFLFNFLVDTYNSILPGFFVHASYNFAVTFMKMNIIDFSKYEVYVIIIASILFVASILYMILEMKALKKRINKINVNETLDEIVDITVL